MYQGLVLPETPSVQLNSEKQKVVALRKIVTDYCTRDNVRGAIAILTDWVIITICWFSPLFFGYPFSNVAATFMYLIAIGITASRMRGLENLVHEASHYNLFSTRIFNDALQTVFAIPVFRLVKEYRKTHLPHHYHLGEIEHDPDVQRYARLGIDKITDRYFWVIWVRPFLGFHTVEYVKTTFVEFWKSSEAQIEKYGIWLTVLTLIILLNAWSWFVLYWLIPFFVVLPVLRFWAESAKHSSLDLNNGVGVARNNIGLVHRLFLHPHNDGFHEVHHLLPTIPWYQLPNAWQKLMQDSYFKTYTVASHSFRQTQKQIKSNNLKLKDWRTNYETN